MARPSNFEPDDNPDHEIAQSEMAAVESLVPKSDRPTKEGFQRMKPPANPSEPRHLELPPDMLQKVLPQIKENSSTPDEYAKNLRRLFNALFKQQHNSEPDEHDKAEIEATIKLQMEIYNLAPKGPGSFMQRRRDELESYQEEFTRQPPAGKPYP